MSEAEHYDHIEAPKPINGRMPIVVIDDDAQIQFLALAPEGMTMPAAYKAIEDAVDEAKYEEPDQWDYDDVMKILKSCNFTSHHVAVFRGS